MAGFSFTWLVVWLISVLVISIILYAVIKSDQPLSGIILYMVYSLWIFIGFITLYKFAWNISGKETITINKEEVQHRFSLFGLGLTRRFEIKNMRELNLAGTKKILVYNRNWKFGLKHFGNIEFKYNSRYHYTGVEIDWNDARAIINAINKYGESVQSKQV